MGEWEPNYLKLYRSGELARRAEEALRGLADCEVCPRDCRIDRLADARAVCRTGRRARVGSYFPHFGEEDCLRGWRGSGTIFFSWCNLRCVFCQNHDISTGGGGRDVTAEELGEMMIELQGRGCHNINFVTPEHVVPQVLEGLVVASERGLRLPLVYNTSAYDSMESLRLLDGVVDIYMPDFKCWDPAVAKRLLKAEDYPQVARRVVREMHRQVGPLQVDERGLARRGILVRHLVMPNGTAGTREVMRFLAQELSPDTYVNVMDQYRPEHKAHKYLEIARKPERQELCGAYDLAREAGLWRFDERRPRPLAFAR